MQTLLGVISALLGEDQIEVDSQRRVVLRHSGLPFLFCLQSLGAVLMRGDLVDSELVTSLGDGLQGLLRSGAHCQCALEGGDSGIGVAGLQGGKTLGHHGGETVVSELAADLGELVAGALMQRIEADGLLQLRFSTREFTACDQRCRLVHQLRHLL